MLQQPVVADFIETGPNISLHNPLGGFTLGEDGETLLQSIGTPAAFAKAIGVSVRQSLGYGCERQRIKRLHGAVVQGGNAEGLLFVIGLGDVLSVLGSLRVCGR